MFKFISCVFLIFALVEFEEIEAGKSVGNFFKNVFNPGQSATASPTGGVPTKSCATSATNPTYDAILSTSSLQFALNIYKQLQNQSNVIISPFSIRVALAMTAVGAQGSTLSQMNSALQLTGFQNQNQINQAFLDLLGSFCTNPNYTLSTANRLYLQQSFPVSQSFVSTLNQSYQADAVNVNFQTDANAVINQINSWVASQTANTIPTLFAPNSLDSSTILVIVNAIYFKGSWTNPFSVSATQNQAFTTSTGQAVQVPMMNLKASFPYAVSTALNSQVLQLNYVGNRLCMYIILPSQNSSLSSLQQKLSAQTFNDFQTKLESREVTVTIPKFTLNFKQQLNSVLQSLGMVNAFSTTLANLSGIATPAAGKNLFVSSVVHQAYVAVDEQGTTASAGTGVSIGLTSVMLNPITFIANRPFFFVIYDRQFNQTLFMGNLNNPNA